MAGALQAPWGMFRPAMTSQRCRWRGWAILHLVRPTGLGRVGQPTPCAAQAGRGTQRACRGRPAGQRGGSVGPGGSVPALRAAASEPPSRAARAARPPRQAPGLVCYKCGCTETPQWRRHGEVHVCNACGIKVGGRGRAAGAAGAAEPSGWPAGCCSPRLASAPGPWPSLQAPAALGKGYC